MNGHCGLFVLMRGLILGCGKKAPEHPDNLSVTDSSAQPSVGTPVKTKVEPRVIIRTPRILAAGDAFWDGNKTEAVQLLKAELAVEEAKSELNWEQLSCLHDRLGFYLGLNGIAQLDEALEHYQKSLAIQIKQLGPDHPALADSYEDTAVTHYMIREFDPALKLLQKALAIRLKQQDVNPPDLANTYCSIGGVHYEKGEYDKALEYCQKGLMIQLEHLGPRHPEVAATYAAMGEMHFKKGEQDKALEHYHKAQAIYLKQTSPEDYAFETATLYHDIGLLHKEKGAYDKALENYQKCLTIFLKQLGAEDLLVASCYINMADAYKAKKDIAKAKEYMEKVLAICLKKRGPEHPETKKIKAELDALKE